MIEKTDNELVSNIKNNIDVQTSIEELERRHTGLFVSQVKKAIFRQHLCEEMMDNKRYIFWKCIMGYDVNRGDAKFVSYLGKAILHESYHFSKKHRELPWPVTEDGKLIDFPEKENQKTDLIEVLEQHLNPRERDILMGVFYYGHSMVYMGKKFNISKQRVYSIIRDKILPAAKKLIQAHRGEIYSV